MNEALLIILILITGITFFNLIKKVGISAPLPASALLQNGSLHYPENFENVLYSCNNRNMNNVYNNLWSITATTNDALSPVLSKITVVYHQCKKSKNLLAYTGVGAGESPFTSDAAFTEVNVCVSSNISDIQYRHVLLEQ